LNKMSSIKKEMLALASKERAKASSWFFKTGKGQYGEGDVFLGLTVPEQRAIAKKYHDLPYSGIKKLLESKYHEHRLTGLLILVLRYQKSKDVKEKKSIAEFYLRNRKGINNWDLVDLSAPRILGNYFFDKDKATLYRFAESQNLWERRIAVLATFWFISKGKFDHSLRIAKMLLNDRHDLIHKAVGWMLREIGKRDEKALLNFLDKHCRKMPRTMLRYAIERLDGKKRTHYMARQPA